MPTFQQLDHIGVDNFAQLGRAMYKYGCGVWTVAILTNGQEVYYDDAAARNITARTKLRGIQIGSIVEGSDAEVGPYLAKSAKQLDELHDRVCEEVEELWNEANMDDEEINPPKRNPRRKGKAKIRKNPNRRTPINKAKAIPKGKRKGDIFTKGGKRYQVISYVTETGKRVRYARAV